MVRAPAAVSGGKHRSCQPTGNGGAGKGKALSEPTEVTEPSTSDGGEQTEPQPQTRTYTQDDLNSVLGREIAKTAAKTRKRIEEDLGISTEEAKAVLVAHKASEEAKLSEAEKARRAAESDRAAAEAAKSEAQQVRLLTRIERVLIRAKATDATVDDGILGPATLKLTPESTDEEIASAVEAFKQRHPALFSTIPDDKAPSGASAASPPRGQAKGRDGIQIGKDRALADAERHRAYSS